ncbi:MAG: RNA polymerase sigma factor [Clostridium sp.]|uniref:RNA polymerase sigma factor n=1 Tax=Clostridium sp. TaxID=1506 RepID=UPI0030558182
MRDFEKVYERQVDRVLKICVLYLKNTHDAEEATQDTFIKYMRYNPVFENLDHEKAWFIKTSSNICKNLFKSSWFKKVICFDNLSNFYKEETEYQLLYKILELPGKYKMPLYLFYYEGYSTEEISKILVLKPATVRSNLHRARNILKSILESGDY